MKIETNSYMPRTAAYEGDSRTKSNSNLSIDDLMKIIAAELSNQPLVGGDSGGGGGKTDYVGQLSQLTMMEQLSEINEGLSTVNLMGQHNYAFSLIGKEVTVVDPKDPGDKDKVVTGEVEKVKFEMGYAILVVDGKDYPMGAVQEVGNLKSKGPIIDTEFSDDEDESQKKLEEQREVERKSLELKEEKIKEDAYKNSLDDEARAIYNNLAIRGYSHDVIRQVEPIKDLEDLEDLQDLEVDGGRND